MTKNTALDALMASGRTSVEEPDPNVIPLPSRVGKNTFVARLRAGLHIQVAADPNDADSFIHGPAEVPLTPKMAIAHMSKWEDPNAVKEWLAREHPALVAGKLNLQPRPKLRRDLRVPRETALALADRTINAQLAAAEAEVVRLRAVQAQARK